MKTTITNATQQKIETWLLQPDKFLYSPYWKFFKYFLPAISFILLILHLTDVLSSVFFYPLIFLMLILSFGISKKVMHAYLQLDNIAEQLESLSDSISWIEKKESRSIKKISG